MYRNNHLSLPMSTRQKRAKAHCIQHKDTVMDKESFGEQTNKDVKKRWGCLWDGAKIGCGFVSGVVVATILFIFFLLYLLSGHFEKVYNDYEEQENQRELKVDTAAMNDLKHYVDSIKETEKENNE